MSTLRDLLPTTTYTSNYAQQQLAVYNTNISAVTNGGQCCCWQVPAGVTWAIFELWGGGGDGAGSCCCMGNYWGPGSGNYTKKRLDVTAGCYFCICAAGSGCCALTCCGQCGYPSWVMCQNGTMATCAGGGYIGCTLCFRSYQGCTGICVPACSYGCTYSGDFAYPSTNSIAKESNYCWSNQWTGQPGSPKFGGTFRVGMEYCTTQLTRNGNDYYPSRWPGGAGANSRACGGGCCFGGWGAGGLVLITYGK